MYRRLNEEQPASKILSHVAFILFWLAALKSISLQHLRRRYDVNMCTDVLPQIQHSLIIILWN